MTRCAVASDETAIELDPGSVARGSFAADLWLDHCTLVSGRSIIRLGHWGVKRRAPTAPGWSAPDIVRSSRMSDPKAATRRCCCEWTPMHGRGLPLLAGGRRRVRSGPGHRGRTRHCRADPVARSLEPVGPVLGLESDRPEVHRGPRERGFRFRERPRPGRIEPPDLLLDAANIPRPPRLARMWRRTSPAWESPRAARPVVPRIERAGPCAQPASTAIRGFSPAPCFRGRCSRIMEETAPSLPGNEGAHHARPQDALPRRDDPVDHIRRAHGPGTGRRPYAPRRRASRTASPGMPLVAVGGGYAGYGTAGRSSGGPGYYAPYYPSMMAMGPGGIGLPPFGCDVRPRCRCGPALLAPPPEAVAPWARGGAKPAAAPSDPGRAAPAADLRRPAVSRRQPEESGGAVSPGAERLARIRPRPTSGSPRSP